MKTFLAWLELVLVLYTAVLIVVYAICYFTGGGLNDTESTICLYGLAGWFLIVFVGYILDPTIPPMKKWRRR